MVLGSKVRFLLIVFKANLKASSSAPEGPLSMDSNIPPEERGNNKKSFKCAVMASVAAAESTTRLIIKQIIDGLQAIIAESVRLFLTL